MIVASEVLSSRGDLAKPIGSGCSCRMDARSVSLCDSDRRRVLSIHDSNQVMAGLDVVGANQQPAAQDRCDNGAMDDLLPPDPPLVGKQIALRPFHVGDAAAIAEACQDSDIPRFTMMPDAMTVSQARQWVERGLEWWPKGVARFAITIPPADNCVGQIGLQFEMAARRAEAFYWLDRRVRGRGAATKALDLVTGWAFRDHGIVRVQLCTHLDNEPSQKVAGRAGFRREGVLRAWGPVKDEQPDVVMWSRLISDPAPDPGHI
jgi:RimJ/RimL family protein N-acetyltransferase